MIIKLKRNKMLPDFPKLKKKTEKATIKVIGEVPFDSPLLSQVRRKTHFEGNRFSLVDENGEYIEKEYKKIQSEFSIDAKEVLERGILAYLTKFIKSGKEMQKKNVDLFLKTIEEATAKTGNQVDSKGKLLTEVYLKALEKVQVDFDENGNPYLPQLIMNPEDVSKQDERISEYLNENPKHMEEYRKKLDKIIEIKRKEWHDRESNRKLVD